TYSWNPGGETTTDIINVTASTYTVTVTDSCGATATASVTVTSPPLLNAVIDSVNVTNAVSCNGKAKVTVTGGIPPYVYKWLPGGQTIDSIYNQCSGAYCCTITDNSGCSKSLCIVINNATGIENISANGGEVNVYPNPTNGVLTIESSIVSGQSTVLVYNMLGEQVYIGKLNAKSTQIDLSANSVGIYLYRVITETGSLIGEGKFIIQR
ncbi:MAG TPA: T9SS type A sorting domain-containing protein, partial [Bacteroidia bacterium]|nr:T9SS type A sorting domain-containing protein [Bacteroidia bacterium]